MSTDLAKVPCHDSGRLPSLGFWLATLGCALWLAACAAPPHGHAEESATAREPDGEVGAGWSITAWGTHFEIFPEVGPLVAGQATSAIVHVSRLEDYSPLEDGEIEMVLASSTGEEIFRAEKPQTPGIFRLLVEPQASEELALSFRIRTPEASEEIRGGRVRVGTKESPGGLLVAPAPKGGNGGEPLNFLKEKQWRSHFSTSWVRRGELAESIEGPARLRPPAGGEAMLSSPLDGVVHGPPGETKRSNTSGAWPFPGQRVSRGTPLFGIVPRIAADRSLATLEAEVASLEIEKISVRQRLERLEELLSLGAASQRVVENERSQAQILETRHQAASRDLASARTARQGGKAGALIVRAPFEGKIAAVAAAPGSTVAAGDSLARLVRTDLVWLEVALPPVDAARLATEDVGGIVLTQGRRKPIRLEEGLRLVAVAPEVATTTGKVDVLLEFPAAEGLALGQILHGQILLRETRTGIVIPASSVVDDGGVQVVYLQLAGERFLRQEIDLLARQGGRVLVRGLEPGQRLVHRGGEAIRRSSLMGSGEAHGHVH